MASAMFSHLQNLWPFSILKADDLKLSNQLVQKLSVPEQTKKFVFASQEPDTRAVIYILAAQNLSQQSALDTEQLIKEVNPKAVVCLVASPALAEVQREKSLLDDQANNVPTSSFGVLKRCLLDKIKKDQYDKFAKHQVLREIFGIGLYGHFLAAKRAAEDIGSQFILLESPYDSHCAAQIQSKFKPGDNRLAVNLKEKEAQTDLDYYVLPFVQSIYYILADLHDIFSIFPAIREALSSAGKMLSNVNKGEPVDTRILSQARNFRVAIEALRIALNEAARFPIKETRKSARLKFSQISSQETSDAISAQALRDQARKFGSLVAIVDAGKLAGLRRHWNTSIPPEVSELTNQCFTRYLCSDPEVEQTRTNALTEKSLITVSAGATAFLRATCLLKTVPFYALIKLATFESPFSKFGLANFKKIQCSGMSTCTLNLPASAEIIRAVAYSLIALAERTGLVAVQASFYEIMRQRRVRILRFGPWATFAGSIAACSGLMVYKDGIECAADSVPLVPIIATMGRGLMHLQRASEEARMKRGTKVQDTLQSLMYSMRSIRCSDQDEDRPFWRAFRIQCSKYT